MLLKGLLKVVKKNRKDLLKKNVDIIMLSI